MPDLFIIQLPVFTPLFAPVARDWEEVRELDTIKAELSEFGRI